MTRSIALLSIIFSASVAFAQNSKETWHLMCHDTYTLEHVVYDRSLLLDIGESSNGRLEAKLTLLGFTKIVLRRLQVINENGRFVGEGFVFEYDGENGNLDVMFDAPVTVASANTPRARVVEKLICRN